MCMLKKGLVYARNPMMNFFFSLAPINEDSIKDDFKNTEVSSYRGGGCILVIKLTKTSGFNFFEVVTIQNSKVD